MIFLINLLIPLFFIDAIILWKNSFPSVPDTLHCNQLCHSCITYTQQFPFLLTLTQVLTHEQCPLCVRCLTSGPRPLVLFPWNTLFSPTPLHSTMLSWISSLQKTVREPQMGGSTSPSNAVLLTHAPPQHCLPVFPTSLQGPCKSSLSLAPIWVTLHRGWGTH